jgi:uncharacterized protein
MKILVSGLSGLVGGELGAFLTTAGHEVVGLSRSPGSTEIGWKPLEGEIDRDGLVGVDAVVHLAGENIAKRWNDKQKRLIRDSRVLGTTTVVGNAGRDGDSAQSPRVRLGSRILRRPGR